MSAHEIRPVRDSRGVATRTPSRPQPPALAVLLNFFGAHVLDRAGGEPVVPTAAAIEVCRQLEIGEHAVRSTLNRMVARDLLDRQRIGRETVYRLTARSRAVLRDGRQRIEDVGAVRDESEVSWVLLAFNLPAAAQRERHILRARLTWAGFGMLQGGLWIAPAPVDLSRLVDDPLLRRRLRIFTADPHPTTDIETLVASIWDLDELASAYRAFIAVWANSRMALSIGSGSLAGELLLTFEWLELLRRDPRLPRRCLPEDWPAAKAEAVFREARAAYATEAEVAAEALLGAARGAPAVEAMVS
jgi:phenylacetic acid degradation operon negative regulatory protein